VVAVSFGIERLSQMVEGLPICKGCFTGTYPLTPPSEDIRGEYIK
jgi:amidophosphoribosyltransferase